MPWKHGTSYSYGKHKCRCAACKEYKRKENAKRSLYPKKTTRQVTSEQIVYKRGKTYVFKHGRLKLVTKFKCAFCGKEQWGGKDKVEKSEKNFCDYQCRAKYDATHRRVVIRCVICKRIRMVPRSHRNKYKTCGRKQCQYARRRKLALAQHRRNGFNN